MLMKQSRCSSSQQGSSSVCSCTCVLCYFMYPSWLNNRSVFFPPLLKLIHCTRLWCHITKEAFRLCFFNSKLWSFRSCFNIVIVASWMVLWWQGGHVTDRNKPITLVHMNRVHINVVLEGTKKEIYFRENILNWYSSLSSNQSQWLSMKWNINYLLVFYFILKCENTTMRWDWKYLLTWQW